MSIIDQRLWACYESWESTFIYSDKLAYTVVATQTLASTFYSRLCAISYSFVGNIGKNSAGQQDFIFIHSFKFRWRIAAGVSIH